MKKYIFFLLISLSFCSCSNDDDNTYGNGKLIVNTLSKPLRYGYIQMPYTGTNPAYDKRQFVVYLSDKPMQMVTVNGFIFPANEQAHVILNFYTDVMQTGNLQQGTYPVLHPNAGFFPDDAYLDQSTFEVTSYNGNVQTAHEATSTYAMQSGRASFIKKGDSYTISFESDGQNETVSGEYKGKLVSVDPGR